MAAPSGSCVRETTSSSCGALAGLTAVLRMHEQKGLQPFLSVPEQFGAMYQRVDATPGDQSGGGDRLAESGLCRYRSGASR